LASDSIFLPPAAAVARFLAIKETFLMALLLFIKLLGESILENAFEKLRLFVLENFEATVCSDFGEGQRELTLIKPIWLIKDWEFLLCVFFGLKDLILLNILTLFWLRLVSSLRMVKGSDCCLFKWIGVMQSFGVISEKLFESDVFAK